MGSCSLLVVDDEKDSANLVKRHMSDVSSCEVSVEYDVERAVKRIREHDFQIIVSDYEMGNLDGLEFFSKVRDESSFILFTGKGSEEVASKAISAGVTDYIRKGGPEQYERLRNRVEKVLERKRAERELEDQKKILEKRGNALEEFHDISTSFKNLDEKIEDILELGIEYFGLESGILSRIEANEYTVRKVKGMNGEIEEGDVVDLENTFCQTVVESEETVYYNGEFSDEIEEHPAYGMQELEVYIGIPIYVKGEIYGTLNFSSTDGIGRQIKDDEKTVVRLMAEWIGKEIANKTSKSRAKAREERLRQVIDNLPQLVFAKDEDGKFLLANKSVANVYGTSVDKLEGSTDEMFAETEEEVKNFREDDMKVINSGKPENIPEEPLTTAKGKQKIFQTTKIPYEPFETEKDAVLGVSHDITDRKKREEALEEILEASREMSKAKNDKEIAETAVKTMETALNLNLCSMHEYSSDENVFRPLAASEKARELLDNMVLEKESSLAGECFEKSESRFFRDLEKLDKVHNPDTVIRSEVIIPVGDYGVLLSGSRNKKNFDQGEIYLAELLASITKASLERAERETKIIERDEELETKSSAMEATMDGIAITEAEGNYIYMNQAHAEMFGRSPEYFIGKHWSSLYPEREVERLEEDVIPKLQDEGSWIGETVGIHRDGSEIIQEITLTLMEDGKLICTNRDITEQRKSKLELEEKNRRLDEFSSIVSHDLRNPLNVAMGYLNLSKESMDREDLDKVENSLNRMKNIIDELLAVSGDAENFQKEELKLSEALEEAIESGNRKINYEIVDDLDLKASRTGLINIFDNMISNSINHNSEEVSIKVGSTENGFYYTDDGHLDPEIEEIEQHGYSTSEKGRGLGISIVKRLAGANDWDIELRKSDEGNLVHKFKI